MKTWKVITMVFALLFFLALPATSFADRNGGHGNRGQHGFNSSNFKGGGHYRGSNQGFHHGKYGHHGFRHGNFAHNGYRHGNYGHRGYNNRFYGYYGGYPYRYARNYSYYRGYPYYGYPYYPYYPYAYYSYPFPFFFPSLSFNFGYY